MPPINPALAAFKQQGQPQTLRNPNAAANAAYNQQQGQNNQPPPMSGSQAETQAWNDSLAPPPPPGSNPYQANISPDILNSMQQYADAAYKASTRQLDPQWQNQQSTFDQQMVAQGLQPGSQAYDNALQQFSQQKNDAYSQARNQSLQQGLQAQGQAFGQGLSNSQLANEILKAQIGAKAQLGAAQASAAGNVGAANINADASMANNTANNYTNQLLGLGNLGLGYNNSQISGLNALTGVGQLGVNQQNANTGANQSDISSLLGLLNQGNTTSMYNNSLPGQYIQSMMPLMGMVPNGGAAPIDVTGAYGMNQAGQNAQYQGGVASANATNQMAGQLGTAAIMMMMMMCSRELKDDQGEADTKEALEAVKALPFHRWKYKGSEDTHIGTFAEDFNKTLGLGNNPFITLIDMMGVILGSVQELAKRIESLEADRA
jgi:hypothetical protein